MNHIDEQKFLNSIATCQAALDTIASTEAFTEVLKHGWISDIGLFGIKAELSDLRNRYLQTQEQIEEAA